MKVKKAIRLKAILPSLKHSAIEMPQDVNTVPLFLGSADFSKERDQVGVAEIDPETGMATAILDPDRADSIINMMQSPIVSCSSKVEVLK